MRIQHNIPAMNSYRNYTNNVSKVAKNLEKLSTGYKINRAGDDAAGLAISEKMRAQITGLATAQKNAKDGISLVQTAEGALTEVHDMLNRMVDLAEQSANGTYDNTTDRYQLQKEVNQLRDEIDRIADSSNFNGINLLDGSMDTSVRNASNVDSLKVVADGQLGKDPQAGVYAIDFSNTKLTAKTDSAQVTFEIWGKTLTLDVGSAKSDTLSGKALADAVATAWNDEHTTTWEADTDGGFLMNATVDGDKVVFTMDKAPSKEFTAAATKCTFAYDHEVVDGNNAEQVTVTQVREAVDVTKGRLYGQASFKLGDVGVSDGKTITIGDETYTFAVGAGSRFAGMANVIDLTDKTTDAKDLIAVAARRLSTAAQGNTRFKVGTTNSDGTITVTEKEGGVDYSVNNLAGKDGKGSLGVNGTKNATADDWAGLIKTGSADPTKGLTLQIGDTAATYNQLRVSIGDCHVSALGISEINISTQDGGAAAMTKIKAAINYVSDVRGTLGATQNRLDHTINNLSVMQQNIQDAESTIRDVDVAEEMMSYTKNNILVQSAQAMLAQANQLPQGVLQLLG